jgi:hypothetical protein
MRTCKDYLRVCLVVTLLALIISCSLTKSHNANDFNITKIVILNDNLVAYCEKQNTIEHRVVADELNEVFAQQHKLTSIRDEMRKQKGNNKDVLMILDDEITAIDMMFGEYKDGVGTIPEKHYLFFASYLKQTNVNLQTFLN